MRYRFRAGGIHLTLSALIALVVFLPIYFFWYPDVLFESAGGRTLFALIVGVDVILGPLITCIIFVPGKKWLLLDLAIIAVVQLSALAYGVYVLFESRPAYIVFVKDRFELVRANQYPDEILTKARGSGYESMPLTGPKIVAARLPTDPKEATALLMSALAGVDVQFYPQYYVPYEKERGAAAAKSKPIAELRRLNPKESGKIDAELAALGRGVDTVRFLPLRAGKGVDLTALVDARNGDLLKIAALSPWAD